MDFQTKQQLMDRMINDTRVLVNLPLIEAFNKVDRIDFVPENLKDESYEDYALPIGDGQSIPQPTTTAFMLELLQVREGQRVLEVGSGSGWVLSLLGYLVGRTGQVFGVEKSEDLFEQSTKNILKYKQKNIFIERSVAGVLGLPDMAPFERILVSLEVSDGPAITTLADQLSVGGIMVIPIEGAIYKITKNLDGSFVEDCYPGFSFCSYGSLII